MTQQSVFSSLSSALLLSFTLVGSGCSSDGSTGTSSSAGGHGGVTSASPDQDSAPDGGSTEDTSGVGGGESAEPVVDEPADNDGAMCIEDDECTSGSCYLFPFFGGQCGECSADADCAGGGCTPHALGSDQASSCNTGQAGDGCESSEVCAGELECGTVIDLLGLFTLSTCGACVDDSDCTELDAPHCVAVFDDEQFTGQRFCRPADSLEQDDYCDLEGGGADHCSSGFCGAVDVMGLAEMWACGECDPGSDNDEGCESGEVCVAGAFDLEGESVLTGARCVAQF